jgi:2-polyprenyl-3-methyl-5-hydroxy-6-metoxy-1,4-benzoquinol methylase
MAGTRERPSFEEANNVTVKRCFYAYEYARNFIKDKVVADIGCGPAYGSSDMARYAASVTGVDYSQATIDENAKQHASVSNLKFVQSIVPPVKLADQSMDVVTAFQFIEHIGDQASFIKDVYRVLKPGGVFLCTTPNAKMSIARNPFHVHEMTFEEMREEAGKVFGAKNIEIKGLQGNEKVNRYYEDNSKWVRRIMKWDVLGLHKIIPAKLLIAPYNWITSLMRDQLREKNDATLEIDTKDFFLQNDQLDNTWDIYLVAHKPV